MTLQLHAQDFNRNVFRAELREEIISFINRNSLYAHKAKKLRLSSMPCCINCLKAHLLVQSVEQGAPSQNVQSLMKSLKGEVGHEGYYMDGDKLIKISLEVTKRTFASS